ncbi:uncharacterized protein LOC122251512 isoform X3 [Penaeus japonicus]|uniref:uncharacterized protein LOC122251512 isoform X3 n=1 Tax=Penaeus japonicus TaxID=27405 RepID=UPI001C713D4E|nr:uncharacterized protein LOC122251512 isoform X3 [Penaeus japonicus]
MSGYIPTWRSVCETWIQESLEEKEGAVTPVFVLYNAYLKDNPEQYLDIAQFGKILKSRFQNRKCRRGKQGSQIYVYKNVIIKPKATDTVIPEDQPGSSRNRQSLYHFSPENCGTSNDIQVVSIPLRQLAMTSKFPRQTEPTSAVLTMDTTLPLDLRHPVVLSRVKAMETPTPYEHSNLEKISAGNSSESRSNTHLHQEEDDKSVCSSLSEISNVIKDNSDGNSESDESAHNSSDKSNNIVTVFKDEQSVVCNGINNAEYIYCNRDLTSPKRSVLLDIEIKDIKVEEESCLHLDYGQANTTSVNVKPIEGESQGGYATRAEGKRLRESSSSGFREIPVQEETSNSVEGEVETKAEPLNRTITETNRMALGRRWMDANLQDRPGTRTFAREVAIAYARDHPDEPLTDTNFAVLIRSKFPSRRKSMKKGSSTVYYYQDLALTNHPGELDNYPALRKTSQENSASNVPTILTSGDEQAPFAVLNPPAESVFIMNGKPFVSVKIVDLPSSGGDSSKSPKRKTLSYELVSNLNTQKGPCQAGLVNLHQSTQAKGIPPAFSQNPKDTVFDSLVDIDPELVNMNKTVTKVGMAVSDYIHSEMLNEEISSRVCEEGRTSSLESAGQTYGDQVTQETDYHETRERITNSKRKSDFLIDVAAKSLAHTEELDINTSVQQKKKTKKIVSASTINHNEKTSQSVVNLRDVGPSKRKSSQGSVSMKCWDSDLRVFINLVGSGDRQREDTYEAKKWTDLNDYDVLKANDKEQTTSEPRKMMVLEHRKRKIRTKRWKSAARNALQNTNAIRIRSVLQVAFQLFSAEPRLTEDQRARRLEAAIYRNNPAVSYRDAPLPFQKNNFACQASSAFIESSESLSYSEVTSLLKHHQICKGLGCSSSSNLCLTLRAAYTHVSICNHRCQVWKHFTDLVALHAKSCQLWDCPVAFCLFMKHEFYLDNNLLLESEQGENLRREFDQCEGQGSHTARLHCCHKPRVQIPLCNNQRATENVKGTECQLDDEVESRALRLLGNFVVPGSSPSFTTPIINTLRVTADMLQPFTSEIK